MDVRITTVTDIVQKQTATMNASLVNLQNTLLRLAGVPETDIANNNQCSQDMTQHDNFNHGTQPVLPGGLDTL